MTTTPGTPSAEDWKRLGKAIEDRRFERGFSQEALVKRGGPSHQTVRNVERGVPSDYRPTTFRKFDRALDWRDGTTEKILNGTATADDINAVALRATGAPAKLGLTATAVGQANKPPAREEDEDAIFTYASQLVPLLARRSPSSPASLAAMNSLLHLLSEITDGMVEAERNDT